MQIRGAAGSSSPYRICSMSSQHATIRHQNCCVCWCLQLASPTHTQESTENIEACLHSILVIVQGICRNRPNMHIRMRFPDTKILIILPATVSSTERHSYRIATPFSPQVPDVYTTLVVSDVLPSLSHVP